MIEFERAITRTPGATFADGITPGLLGRADAALAQEQHRGYIAALEKCGVEVITLEADDAHPDSCFVEDPAIVNDRVAVITAPCKPSRQGEEDLIRPVIESIYGSHVEQIKRPGTLEGGDICRVDEHYLIGISDRTNENGAQQLADILKKYGFTSEFVDMCIPTRQHILHLKTGMTYLGNNVMLLCPALADDPVFEKYEKIFTDEDDAYSVNVIPVNGHVIMAKGFEKTAGKLRAAGYDVIEVPVTEFEKQDGGLTCLSLRIPKLRF